ncbi:hypothetical protein GCM10010377_81560 [Streptomyces viridiviolaceus]|nr:hypothetical protein GCM10010377_81560 [Streptomyces viridiviolaceus]
MAELSGADLGTRDKAALRGLTLSVIAVLGRPLLRRGPHADGVTGLIDNDPAAGRASMASQLSRLAAYRPRRAKVFQTRPAVPKAAGSGAETHPSSAGGECLALTA